MCLLQAEGQARRTVPRWSAFPPFSAFRETYNVSIANSLLNMLMQFVESDHPFTVNSNGIRFPEMIFFLCLLLLNSAEIPSIIYVKHRPMHLQGTLGCLTLFSCFILPPPSACPWQITEISAACLRNNTSHQVDRGALRSQRLFVSLWDVYIQSSRLQSQQ